MKAMYDFEYKHGNQVVLNTTYGKVVLTYVDPKKRKEEDPLGSLYDREVEWEHGYFEAALYDSNGQIIEVAEYDNAYIAVKMVIMQHLENELHWEMENL